MAEYIDREKALKAVCPYEDGDYFQEVNVLLKCIESVPAADVAPVVHGRWEVSDTPCERFKCSECGGGCWYYDYQGDVAKSRYCPSCGAKMDKEASNGLEDS